MNHNKKNFEIHKVKDDFNNTVKQKHNLFNLPFKLLIVGKIDDCRKILFDY